MSCEKKYFTIKQVALLKRSPSVTTHQINNLDGLGLSTDKTKPVRKTFPAPHIATEVLGAFCSYLDQRNGRTMHTVLIREVAWKKKLVEGCFTCTPVAYDYSLVCILSTNKKRRYHNADIFSVWKA